MTRRLSPVLVLFVATAVALAADDKNADPQPSKGETITFSFEKSKVFPGTSRGVTVYVPSQYDGKTPACVYVSQDGLPGYVGLAFEKLIAEKAMPVTIAIGVTPGVVKAANPDALPRFNRSYEYDGLGGDYVKFLVTELLPEVETKATQSGRKVVLSPSGVDRAIGGASSGAICAFTAAWERPDEFSRVFSTIGTYVGLRGGDVYPTLIRKFEPRPIRVYLQDGSKDLNIYGGDWWMANQTMQRALTFAGYEVKHSWNDGGHNGGLAAEVFPEAMKFLWEGHPKPVKAGQGSQQLKEILIPGEDWKLVGEGYKFTEGPATNAKGDVFFNDVGSSKTFKVVDGKAVEWLADSKRGDGQRFGPDGKLYTNASGVSKVLAWDADGKSTEFATGFKGNDLVVLNNGAVYATDPFEVPNNSKVYYVSPKGEAKVVDTGLKFANGITVSPDQTLLYVADSRTHWVYSYQIAADGSLAYKQKYYHLHVHDKDDDSGADGLRADRDGRLWVATKSGLQVCDQAGRVNCIIPTPNGKVSNLTFGGPDMDTVYATCGDRVFSRKMKAKGANAFEPPFKPAPPRL
ncbi:gluconolactonase : Gluconolactonase OS=Singulisphaera acidiphila (strain ATCC BAA-1392 / DSM 18658 / VKM B-2454 / MOB10) GN=Sinac_2387 PE=4 SV=1: Esterase: SGL [Gemmataceae bacterium]|nr:gluconolactonase : Gluconolactonase OS=Singulisphaera acidiphila (strain ATCC BAA-1392 / DSM 18658 / VKM B-2454 / MOB10) GN=Sinac_2387 PE=4 SV=1: Esterase: SGL [Gemmataceae bacterium]VTT99434.1 gluconolactonase : Gluconolactonase OS=Singulisphaera acidiphila (strain ATCC BAA-1392 / DSM 18658 / VKM B-2454 / MOB10) GN=Sinac_2387 PE=4 SV=1: Esterase: SGL [Gemmataceae bacterium]